jgi:signal transduction histidine kinase
MSLMKPSIPTSLDLETLKAYLSAQPRRVRLFNEQLEVVWANCGEKDLGQFLPGHRDAIPPEGEHRHEWPVHLVLQGEPSANHLYTSLSPGQCWKVTAWPLVGTGDLLIVEETEEVPVPMDDDVMLKKLDKDIEELLHRIFEYLHKGNVSATTRLANPHLTSCVENRSCTNKNCPAYKNNDVARCWEVTAFNDVQDTRDIDLLSKFHACSECGIFEMAAPDSYSRIAENFNRLISLLQLKYQEALDVQYRMQQADKLAVMGQLLGGIAHEIKNPLGIIIGRLDIIGLEMDSLDPAELSADFATIYEQANRIRHIIDGLLDTARPEPPKFRPIHINGVILDSLKMVRKALADKGIRVYLDMDEELPPIPADQIQMQQVLLNLILNARDAMENGGTLRITSQLAKAPQEGVEVIVTDTGEGIAPEQLRRLFSSYQTTKLSKGGTGLGLAVCSRIMEVHNGRISATSTLQVGTSMRLWLPLTGVDV